MKRWRVGKHFRRKVEIMGRKIPIWAAEAGVTGAVSAVVAAVISTTVSMSRMEGVAESVASRTRAEIDKLRKEL